MTDLRVKIAVEGISESRATLMRAAKRRTRLVASNVLGTRLIDFMELPAHNGI